MKWFKSSFWLAAVCICERAFYDDLCDVYVICTCTVTAQVQEQGRLPPLCSYLWKDPCQIVCCLFNFYLFFFSINLPKSSRNHLTSVSRCFPLCSWKTHVPLLLRTCSATVMKGRSQMHKIVGGGCREIMLSYQPEHITSHFFPPETATPASQGCWMDKKKVRK